MTSILVVGPGAIGAIVAARMAPHADVTVACRTAASAKAIARDGLQVTGLDGRTTTTKVATTTKPVDADTIVLATRCQDAVAAAKRYGKQGTVVAIQNGLMGPALANVANDRLLMATVAFPATRTGIGRSTQTGPGAFHVGPWPTGTHPEAQRVATLLRHVAPTQVHADMEAVAWSKLMVNSCITSLGALTGQGLGQLLKVRAARDAFLDIVREGVAVARAEGVRPAVLGTFRPSLLAGGGRWRALQHGMLLVAARKQKGHRSSSLQALERGGETEVRYLNGRILEGAAAHGLEAPTNARILELVQRVEAGEEPGVHWLARLQQ